MSGNRMLSDMTQAELKSVLVYRPRLGRFEHVDGTPCHSRVQSRGYIQMWIKHKKKCYLAHRLAWLYMTGAWPDCEIDHDDGDPSNNRWKNLKAATTGHQRQNSAIRRNNTSGHTGISWKKSNRKWAVQLGISYKLHNGGYYANLADAVVALKKLKAKLHTYHPDVVTRSTKLIPTSPRHG